MCLFCRGESTRGVKAHTLFENESLKNLCSRNFKMERKRKRRGAWSWKAIVPRRRARFRDGEYVISNKTLQHYYFQVFVPVLSRT
jgi:hypothetical protein